MKRLKIAFFILLGMSLAACESLVEGINDDPNNIPIDAVSAVNFLRAAQIANIQVQLGHEQRITSSWTGQMVGYQNLYKSLYEYNMSSEESNGFWSFGYQGVITQVRHIRKVAETDKLLVGISKVMEAHTIGTMAAAYGDIPYAEAINPEISDPKFDSQRAVFNALQTLLDEAIADLTGATKRALPEDLYYAGDNAKWVEAAYTLKARYFTLTKEYDKALIAAQKGVSKVANSMLFKPLTSSNLNDKNLLFQLFSGSRSGDLGNRTSYLITLINPANANSRNNAKTQENARHAYLLLDERNGGNNKGAANSLEPMPLITYQENQLTLAECAARTQGFDQGLQHLNAYRAALASGTVFKKINAADPLKYDAYVAADFDNGGMENATNLAPLRALLREIVEERYISFFSQWLVFNDARRLRKSDSDIAVKFPLNTPTATKYPERIVYAQNELNANENAKEPAEGIYFVVEVNR
ncbi:MAG: SusD/RagB family nutrient-binding outer membrane lipoprotein [Haliscomenobacter sp.]|nr:SusD/RagB family nutrient-binding outer membrane lipoprotein [Haliscomenobacter sp.]